MSKFLPTDLNIKSFIKYGVFASFLLISSLVSAQLQRTVIEKVDTNRAIISQDGFDSKLKSASPEKFLVSDQEIVNATYASRTNGPSVINGDFESGNHYWARYNAHTVNCSSQCGGHQAMKLYGNWCGVGGVIRGFLNNLTPGQTYTLHWKEYVWEGYSSDYYVYVDGYNHIDNDNNQTGWVSRNITFTAEYHCQYLWFLNDSHYNLYIDCVDVEEDSNCNDLAFDIPDEEICNGDSVTLDGPDGFDTYAWSTGETTQSITVSPNTATVYTLNVTLGDCNLSNALEVRVNEPFAGIEGDSEICLGESSTLTVVGEEGLTYLWSTGETTESIIVSPSGDTEYSVTVNDGTCTSVERFTVNVTDISFDLEDQTINFEESAVLTAPDGMDTYLWSTGETTQVIVVTPDNDTVYTITVTRFGCEFTDTLEVIVNNGGSGDRAANGFDAKVSIDGILSIDSNTSKHMEITYQVHSLNGLSAGSRVLNVSLAQGSNSIKVNLNQYYNLRANTYYVLVINSADLDSPRRVKFIAR